MRLRCVLILIISLLPLQFASVSAQNSEIHHGAQIYLERCALCHGSKGLGEGPIALLVRGYPDTSLKTTGNHNQVKHIVEFGTTESGHSLSPPWRYELQSSEIDAVTAFVEVLQSDFGRALQELAAVDIPPERIDGRKVYRARCESCHGATGKGDGRMSRVIRNPPPSDLTRSALSYEDTVAIVSKGGKDLGRSDRMPPWGQELVQAELLSVANYLKTLRIANPE